MDRQDTGRFGREVAFAARRCFRKESEAGKGGGHIAAAGKEQPVKSIGMPVYIGSVRKDNCLAGGLFQSGFIVFMKSGRTYDSGFFHGGSFFASYIMICVGGEKCSLDKWYKGIA